MPTIENIPDFVDPNALESHLKTLRELKSAWGELPKDPALPEPPSGSKSQSVLGAFWSSSKAAGSSPAEEALRSYRVTHKLYEQYRQESATMLGNCGKDIDTAIGRLEFRGVGRSRDPQVSLASYLEATASLRSDLVTSYLEANARVYQALQLAHGHFTSVAAGVYKKPKDVLALSEGLGKMRQAEDGVAAKREGIERVRGLALTIVQQHKELSGPKVIALAAGTERHYAAEELPVNPVELAGSTPHQRQPRFFEDRLTPDMRELQLRGNSGEQPIVSKVEWAPRGRSRGPAR